MAEPSTCSFIFVQLKGMRGMKNYFGILLKDVMTYLHWNCQRILTSLQIEKEQKDMIVCFAYLGIKWPAIWAQFK